MILSQMSRRFLAVLLAAAPLVALAQDDGLPPGILLLSRIKRHVAEELARLPDYTCLETAQRYHKGPGASTVLKPLDTLRLEVLDTGDKELYAPPGSHTFQKDHPGEFTNTGLSGTGLFALYVRNLLVNDKGLFQYRGEERLGGRRAVRYDYRVPLLQSGMTVQVGSASGRVASKGSFWADPDTLDLLRLDIAADDIPPNLAMESSLQTITYARTRIGDRSIVLPQTAEMDLVESDGSASRNVLEFTHCRAYQTTSTVTFVSEAPAEEIPAGVTIPVVLAAPITGAESPGALLEGRAAADVAGKSGVLVRAGAVVHGRIRRLEPPLVAIEFTEIVTGDVSLRFFAELLAVDAPAAVAHPAGAALPGVGAISSPHFPIPAGFRMLWRTKAL